MKLEIDLLDEKIEKMIKRLREKRKFHYPDKPMAKMT